MNMAESEMQDKPVNQRSLARLAAVQALYQMDVSGTSLTNIVAEFESYRLGKEVDGEQYRDADPAWFRATVSQVVWRQKIIDPLINDVLPDGWNLARVEITLRAVMRCAVVEFLTRKDVPAKVIISEYLEVTKAFFERAETNLVNGVLDAIARKQRLGELDEVEADEGDKKADRLIAQENE